MSTRGQLTVCVAVVLLFGSVRHVQAVTWQITQLTNNSYDDERPQVSGSNVVWQRYDGSDWEIFLYDGTGTTQLTNNIYNDYCPQVRGSNVVWYGWDGSDYEIFLATPEPSTLALLGMAAAGLRLVPAETHSLGRLAARLDATRSQAA